ncbi:MAG TPA: hypothetical protein DCM28_05840 [Phycisphaerales bacterium]|nr:hypothetical protein [Phycisphaerales bacterium]
MIMLRVFPDPFGQIAPGTMLFCPVLNPNQSMPKTPPYSKAPKIERPPKGLAQTASASDKNMKRFDYTITCVHVNILCVIFIPLVFYIANN